MKPKTTDGRKSMADFELVGLVESPIVVFIPAKL